MLLRRLPTVPAVDWLKALAIVAVLVAHAGPFAFGPLTPTDRTVRTIFAAFHVPVFLLVSGYLHASATPLSMAGLWRRWRRVLGPYVVASVVVTAFGLQAHATWATLPWNLSVGNALGVYYYVFVWCGCVLTGWLWARGTDRMLVVALGLVTLATMARMATAAPVGFLWALRDPLLQGWLCCYLLGWCARRFGWDRGLRAYPGSALLGVALMLPWILREAPAPGLRIVYSVGVAVVVVALAPAAPAVVRWVARETLWIYLAHIPVMHALLPYARHWSPGARIAGVVAATLACCVAGVACLRLFIQADHPGARKAHVRPRRAGGSDEVQLARGDGDGVAAAVALPVGRR